MAVLAPTPYLKSCQGTSDTGGVREYEQVFYVKTEKNDGANIAGNAVGLPERGQTYVHPDNADEADTGAVLVSITPKPVGRDGDGNIIWDAVCRYSSAGGDPTNPNTEPSSREIAVDYGSASYIHYPQKDLDGKAFLVAGTNHPYDAQPIEETVIVMTVSAPFLTFNPKGTGNLVRSLFDLHAAAEYQNSVNNQHFAGCEIGTVLCKTIRAREMYNSFAYLMMTFEFHVRRDDSDPERSWQLDLLQQGPTFVNAAGDVVPIELEGALTTEHRLLDTDGTLLPEGADPVYNEFKIRKTRDLNSLGLGTLLNFSPPGTATS